MDIRLDYINKFNPGAVEEMTEIRQAYIDLDNRLTAICGETNDPALKRTYALARTNLEISSMYAIKSCCLAYEEKS